VIARVWEDKVCSSEIANAVVRRRRAVTRERTRWRGEGGLLHESERGGEEKESSNKNANAAWRRQRVVARERTRWRGDGGLMGSSERG
jgi:hypothetical protein